MDKSYIERTTDTGENRKYSVENYDEVKAFFTAALKDTDDYTVVEKDSQIFAIDNNTGMQIPVDFKESYDLMLSEIEFPSGVKPRSIQEIAEELIRIKAMLIRKDLNEAILYARPEAEIVAKEEIQEEEIKGMPRATFEMDYMLAIQKELGANGVQIENLGYNAHLTLGDALVVVNLEEKYNDFLEFAKNQTGLDDLELVAKFAAKDAADYWKQLDVFTQAQNAVEKVVAAANEKLSENVALMEGMKQLYAEEVAKLNALLEEALKNQSHPCHSEAVETMGALSRAIKRCDEAIDHVIKKKEQFKAFAAECKQVFDKNAMVIKEGVIDIYGVCQLHATRTIDAIKEYANDIKRAVSLCIENYKLNKKMALNTLQQKLCDIDGAVCKMVQKFHERCADRLEGKANTCKKFDKALFAAKEATQNLKRIAHDEAEVHAEYQPSKFCKEQFANLISKATDHRDKAMEWRMKVEATNDLKLDIKLEHADMREQRDQNKEELRSL